MDPFVRAFLQSSLTWLCVGVTLGVLMAAMPSLVVYRPAHLHMLTLGFVAMMIFGVAYHVIPRFTGHALHSRTLPTWHWWASNVGLLLMSTGFVLRSRGGTSPGVLLSVGAVLSAAGAYAFAYVMWRTISGTKAREDRVPRATLVSLHRGE